MSELLSLSIALIWLTASALLTKDAAIKSTPWLIANIISSLSLEVIAGKLSFVLGMFIPFLLPKTPPEITSHIRSVSVISLTSNSIRPSSINIWVPTSTSLVRFLYVTETFVSSPTTSSVVKMKVSPFTNVTFLSSFRVLVLISGP